MVLVRAKLVEHRQIRFLTSGVSLAVFAPALVVAAVLALVAVAVIEPVLVGRLWPALATGQFVH